MITNKENSIDLSGLPRKSESRIDWGASIGCEVPFIYDGINGILQIIDYNSPKVTVLYNDNKYAIFRGNLQKCQLNNIVNSGFKYEIGQHIKDSKRDMIILDRKIRFAPRPDKTYKEKAYNFHCNKCGWNDGWLNESQLSIGRGCSCCSGKTVVPGINSVADTDPWIIDYFPGGYEEAKQYTRGSYKKISFQCPYCKDRSTPTYISNITRDHGFSCSCRSKISYPERFMKAFLNVSKVKFIHQLSKTTFSWCGNYRYDFYLLDYNCIIEVHGLQHYEPSKFFRIDFEDEIKNDTNKKELALSNNINRYIEIDARLSDFNYLKNSVLSNKTLNQIIETSKVNWDNVLYEIYKSNYYEICDMWNNGENAKIIAKNLGLSKNHVISVLKLSYRNDDTDYTTKNPVKIK